MTEERLRPLERFALTDLFGPLRRTLYVQLEPTRVTVRDAASGRTTTDVPEIAWLQGQASPLAVGNDARRRATHAGVAVLNPFTHPRTLVSDFTGAAAVLRGLVKRFRHDRRPSLAPRIVLHPLGEHEGGLTQVEARALLELALAAGAAVALVWVGTTLSDADLRAGSFPPTGRIVAR